MRRLRHGAGVVLALARGYRNGIKFCRVQAGASIVVRDGAISADRTMIGSGVRIAVVGTPTQEARLQIGDHSSIGDRTIINVRESVIIGPRCQISWNCQLMDTDFHTIYDADGNPIEDVLPIDIGSDVLIGTGAIILKGVTIGSGSVVAAGSVVTRNVPQNCIVAGNPARVIRRITRWS